MTGRVEYHDGTITVEYELAPKMVVFSHGFGVRRDDRGLLSDIAKALPNGYGYLLFDYYDVNERQQNPKTIIEVKSFTDQQRRLQAVLAWVGQQKGVVEVDVIAHSLGCAVVAAVSPDVAKLICLAPPLLLGGRFKLSYTERDGAKLQAGIWHIPRTDGTTTNVANSFFTAIGKLDGESLMLKLAERHPFTMVLPSEDEVLTDTDYTELLVSKYIDGLIVDDGNHSFTGIARRQLLILINDWLLD